MPGLLQQGMAPQTPPPMAPAAAPGATPGQGQAPAPATPGAAPTPGFDQKDLLVFLANGTKMIHNEKVSDTIIAMVVKSKDPTTALADATLNIVNRLEQGAKTSGKKLPFMAVAAGANVLMGEIIASAEAAGMKKIDDKTKFQAISLTVGKYLDDAIKTGKMTKEELAKLGEEAGATPAGQKINQQMTKMTARTPTGASAPVPSPAPTGPGTPGVVPAGRI